MSMATLFQSLIKTHVAEKQTTDINNNTAWKSRSLDVTRTTIPATGSTRIIDILAERPWGSGLFSLGDIRIWVEDQTYTFHTHLNELLRLKKIDLSRAIQFRINGFGNVVMSNHHEDALVIEAVINGNFTLRKQFIGICATSRFLKAIETMPEFKELYKTNPEMAVEKYNILEHSPSPYLFEMTSTIDSIQYAFAN